LRSSRRWREQLEGIIALHRAQRDSAKDSNVKPSELPTVGPISNPVHDFYNEYSSLAGKRLLCIGFSEDEVQRYVARYDPGNITMLTKWVDHADASIKRYPLVVGDITARTHFADDSFDAVLTLSVLEHLSDLRSAFKEMVRLVRRGGEMLHMFGPAWSCAYGHHIYADPADPLLNFSLWRMPAHMHLLSSHDEIKQFYRGLGYSESVGETVLHWFYDTPIINRLFYDDYVRVMSDDNIQIDKMHLMYNELPREHLLRLRRSYPDRIDFATYGGRYRLIVRK
jgi:SAM-dependent methyltransferase